MARIGNIVSMLVFSSVSCIAQGTIVTVAGNGTPAFSGDGGPAISAALNGPDGVAVDAAGNLYIGDAANNRVRKVTPAGIISTVAGNGSFGFSGDGGPAINAALRSPDGIALDASGNLYVADTSNNRVRKVTPEGTISTVAGSGSGSSSGDGGPATSAGLHSPFGVAVDALGNLYISEADGNRVRKVTPAGIISTVAGTGTAAFSGDGGPAASAELNSPREVALDTSGNLYIAEASNNRIRKVTPAGIITTVAGNGVGEFSGDGGPAISAGLRNPEQVAVDVAGNLYIGDANNNRIRKVVWSVPATLSTTWIGLKNSDDQGTQFDLRAELYKNDILITSGQTLCITGVTRNPNLAKEAMVTFAPIVDQSVNPGDMFSLKVLTRIGTTPEGAKCPGPGGSHSSATGLRLYYDSASRPSRFGSADSNLFLHSSGENLYFDGTAPMAGTPKFKDSSSVSFTGGNPWKEVSTWVSLPFN